MLRAMSYCFATWRGEEAGVIAPATPDMGPVVMRINEERECCMFCDEGRHSKIRTDTGMIF